MEYVLLGCLRDRGRKEVLLVEKERPDWQKGRYNLPGGKVDPGETHREAAIRELKEETGYEASHIFDVGRIEFDGGCVYCKVVWEADGAFASDPQPREGEDERFFWTDWGVVQDNPRLMPNLRIIVPLMISQVNGWVIGNEREGGYGTEHAVTVTVPTYCHPFL